MPSAPPSSELERRVPKDGATGASAGSTLSPDGVIREERRRMVRERWMHLLLLGFALSVVAHVIVMLQLWASEVPGRAIDGPPAVELNLQALPPAVEVVAEDIELPDPSPQVVGPVTMETDPIPNLSADLASDNPSVETFGAIEAPGIGSIVGAGGSGSGIGIGSGQGGGGTSFFGIGGRGTRFAYIVDVSGSMEHENRLVTAIAELKRSIGALPDYAEFYVALYSNGAIIADFQRQGGWLRATRTNISRTRQWLDAQQPRGGTFPLEAIDIVFRLPQPPDVIFFLTDGEIPPETPQQFEEFVAKRGRPVIVNTIGFSSDAGRAVLSEIARANKGVFRFVPSQGRGGQP